jgi:hypothetical protein
VSVTIPYSHPDLEKDRYFEKKVTIQVPLGIQVLDYRSEKKGERMIIGDKYWDSPQTANYDGISYSSNLIIRDHRPEIAKLYGKPADQLVAPEGYEFTGEFRKAVLGETLMTDWTHEAYTPREDTLQYYSERLILRPIVKISAVAGPYVDFQALKDFGYTPPPTAEDIKERYGRELLDTFYGRPDVIQDVPGFTFTGRLQSVPPGDWYLNTAGQPKKSGKYGTVGLYLTLNKIAGPRIITYTLTALDDVAEGEAMYCQDDMGGMMTDTLDTDYTYTRSEVE